MSGRTGLIGWFALVLALMSAVTLWASLQGNVLAGFAEVWRAPWGRATLFDAYFSFVAVWLWIAWRERTFGPRLGWLVAICLLGNFAIAAYFLLQLRGADPSQAALDALFGRRAAGAEAPR